MVILLAVLVLAVVVCVVMRVRRRTRRKITDTSGASNNLHNPTYTGSVIAERLSARHLIFCSTRSYCPSRSLFGRNAPSRSIVRHALLRMRERMAGA